MVGKIVVEEFGVNRGTAKHRIVLFLACAVEGGVGIGASATLLNLIIQALQAWEDSGFWGGAEPFRTPLLHVAAFMVLPVVAVLAGASPPLLRENSSMGGIRALGLSVILCLGAGLLWITLFALGLNAENLPNLVRLVFIPAIPFILVPLLVVRWA